MLKFMIKNAIIGAATSTPYLLFKPTSTLDTYEVTENGTDIPVGVSQEKCVAADVSSKRFDLEPVFGPRKVIASAAIAVGGAFAAAAGGKIQPVSADGEFILLGFALEAASADGDELWVYFCPMQLRADLTVGAEAANAITVGVQANVPGVFRYRAQLIDRATGVIQATAAFTIAETGDGAAVSTNTQGELIFTTSAAGAATLTVTDVSGSSTKGLSLILTPLNVQGVVHETLLQFA